MKHLINMVKFQFIFPIFVIFHLLLKSRIMLALYVTAISMYGLFIFLVLIIRHKTIWMDIILGYVFYNFILVILTEFDNYSIVKMRYKSYRKMTGEAYLNRLNEISKECAAVLDCTVYR
jgi:hypothetical protein